MDWVPDRDEGETMTDRTAAPLITAPILGQAVAGGLLGGVLTVEHHPRLLRGLGLAVAGGVGTWTALAAFGVIAMPSGSGDEDSRGSVPPAVAAAMGVGMCAALAGASEVGIRAQGRFERWAGDTFGRPRLVLGVVTGALSLAFDVAAREAERRSA